MALVNNAVTLQGSQLNISFRPTGVGTFKYAICQSNVTLKNTTPTSITYTNCGALTAVGIVPSFTGTVELVFTSNIDLTVDLGINELYSYQFGSTLLDFQIENPTASSAGSNLLRQGQCYITDVSESFSPNDFLKATITFTGTNSLVATGV